MATDNENRFFDEDEEEYPTGQPDDDNYVELYSKTAIWAFTIFFGVIFGGVLLMQNLRNAGYKKAGVTVLLFSISFSILTVIASFYVLGRYSGLIFNIAGGAILTEYFFKKYFPDEDYYPRPVWGALAVSIIIVLVLSLIALYIPGFREQLEMDMK